MGLFLIVLPLGRCASRAVLQLETYAILCNRENPCFLIKKVRTWLCYLLIAHLLFVEGKSFCKVEKNALYDIFDPEHTPRYKAELVLHPVEVKSYKVPGVWAGSTQCTDAYPNMPSPTHFVVNTIPPQNSPGIKLKFLLSASDSQFPSFLSRTPHTCSHHCRGWVIYPSHSVSTGPSLHGIIFLHCHKCAYPLCV